MKAFKEAFWDLAMVAGAFVVTIVLVGLPIAFIEFMNYLIRRAG